MAKPKRPRDTNQLAKLIVDISTGATAEEPVKPVSKRRAGGLKGGVIRAQRLPKFRRVQIAKKAARTRWAKPRKAEVEDS